MLHGSIGIVLILRLKNTFFLPVLLLSHATERSLYFLIQCDLQVAWVRCLEARDKCEIKMKGF